MLVLGWAAELDEDSASDGNSDLEALVVVLVVVLVMLLVGSVCVLDVSEAAVADAVVAVIVLLPEVSVADDVMPVLAAFC